MKSWILCLAFTFGCATAPPPSTKPWTINLSSTFSGEDGIGICAISAKDRMAVCLTPDEWELHTATHHKTLAPMPDKVL